MFDIFGFQLGVTTLALVIEAAFGYPACLFRAIRHPVVWIGALISCLDRRLNRPELGRYRGRARGVCTLAIVVAVAAGPAWLLQVGILHRLGWPCASILLGLIAASLPAQRSLHDGMTPAFDLEC